MQYQVQLHNCICVPYKVSEVNSARNKLDGVLQTLMDKADDR